MKLEVVTYNEEGRKLKYQAFEYENHISALADFEALTAVFDRLIQYHKGVTDLRSRLSVQSTNKGGET